MIFVLLSTLIIFSKCAKEPIKDNSPIIVFTAIPNPVNFLSSTHLSWDCKNVTECTLNGQKVATHYNKFIYNIISDTTFILECSGPNGNISKTLTVKVGEKPLYIKYLDTLCTGKWVVTQSRTYGIPWWGNKPDEWYIGYTPMGDLSDGVDFDDNPMSFVFIKGDKYSNLKLMLLDENYLISEPVEYILSTDLKTLKFCYALSWGGKEKPREILNISNDSLVLFRPSAGIVWSGGDGSGSGFFPRIDKYEHYVGYNNIISTNNTTSNVYKILTANYWKLDSEKMYHDGIYQYSTTLSKEVKDIRFYFQTDGVFAGYLSEKLVQGPNRWYLVDNNTKIRLAGYIPTFIYEIAYIDDYKLIVKRAVRFNDDKKRFSIQESCYIRN